MSQRLTDALVKTLEAPKKGNKIYYDDKVKGFGLRVTAKGARAFVFNYRTKAGRERRSTIGTFVDGEKGWKTTAARAEAAELKQRIDRGEDPLEKRRAERTAPTVADLCERFETDHLPRLRPSTRQEYKAQIRRCILPSLKHRKVAEITFSDIDSVHRKITRDDRPYYANRVLSLLSKMFNLAIRWGWRTDNPCKGVERNREEKRTRYLSGDEIARLTEALAEHEDQQAANIVRLLLLTGARRGEVMAVTWDQFDLEAGVWSKPSAATKQRAEHRVPLSAPARQLLAEIRAAAESEAKKKGGGVSQYVFPSRTGGPRNTVHKAWCSICAAAGLVTSDAKPSVRVHDLRHTFASVLASSGLSLPIIGRLLGHSQTQTTARYAHLFDDPLRAATERAGAILAPPKDRPESEVTPIKRGQ